MPTYQEVSNKSNVSCVILHFDATPVVAFELYELGALMSDAKSPDRNLAMELVRVTEAAAMAAARWIGRGDKGEQMMLP